MKLNPGPNAQLNIRCFYINGRSMVNKLDKLRDSTEHNNKRGGDVILAIRNTTPSTRRPDIETSGEFLAYEYRPSGKKKILLIAYHRPPNSDLKHVKEFTKSLSLASGLLRIMVSDLFQTP